VADLLNLQVRTIVIDPGHGGRDPGTVGPTGLTEKAVTLDVARRLRDRLDRHGAFEVLLTRDDDRAVGLDDRVALANGAGADLYVSVHVNAFADPALAPVETYYFGVEADSAALALARAANAGTAFSVADFTAALRRAGTAVKLQESRALARAVQDALVATRPADRRRWVDEGARPAPFAVLLYTDAPAVLAEVTALSNPAEEARLRRPEARDRIAAALEAGVLAYLRSPPSTAPLDAPEEDR
jgi:N-acetylmuramoyl-L-alanine amidase